jgi:MutS domain V
LSGVALSHTLTGGLTPLPTESTAHSNGAEPQLEYGRRLEALVAAQTQYRKRDALLGSLKLALLAAGGALAVWLLAARISQLYWLAAPVIAFLPLVAAHERVLRGLRRCDRAIAFYERGLARLADNWPGKGEPGDRFLDPAHPYARDLDLFGKGSLFELLCAARTRSGEETLARWLLAPAPPAEVGARNAGVAELRERLVLREDLAVLGEDVRLGVHPEKLTAWARAAPLLSSSGAQLAAAALSVLWLASAVAWAGWGLRWVALLVSAVNIAFAYAHRKAMESVIPSAENTAKDIALLSEVLARLERESFSSPKLTALRDMLQAEGVPPSRAIARLGRLVGALESRRSPVLAVFDVLVLWSLHLTFAIERWRKHFGAAVPRWLTAVGEMEALSSLAGYAYEHPGDVFPEFDADSPRYEAQGFAHPLIPESRAVRNDLRLGRELRLIIISGPNMAGKSTFIRTVGMNAVLAQCGAPVRARSLRLSPLAVAASVCILDSLQGGISRFYAEIARLKLISDMAAGATPILYLLDELLSGTNSHDRRIGAQAVVRTLFQHGALGLVTTHDLALAEIAASLGPEAANFHFEDHLEAGQLRFDYRLTPGIVQTSNALDLMRSIGFDV